jgi:hypothetical protein
MIYRLPNQPARAPRHCWRPYSNGTVTYQPPPALPAIARSHTQRLSPHFFIAFAAVKLRVNRHSKGRGVPPVCRLRLAHPPRPLLAFPPSLPTSRVPAPPNCRAAPVPASPVSHIYFAIKTNLPKTTLLFYFPPDELLALNQR